jgi:hypothetical protein
MSTGSFSDRRVAPRIAVSEDIECRLDWRTRVRVLDISLSGALLAAEVALPVGERAELRSSLGATAFRTDVQLLRTVTLPTDVSLKGLGAVFTTMDERSRRSLEDFLRKASQ